jgi:EAL domain-containing protein (putative c-di-GMP-specific phosphodiesterase class I)
VDYLKIDGSFVRDILSSPTDEAIVKSINEVAHFMGKQTIAEFVCDEPIRERLQEIGVDYVQGYAVAKPAYLDEMVQPGESPGVD